MITQDTEVYDNAGAHLGTVRQVFVDPDSGHPQWVTVRTGTLSHQESFVPLHGARFDDDRLTVAVAGDRVRQAPLLDPDSPLTNDEADRLYAHYGLGSDDDDAMTRSEERLRVSTERVPTRKVRLRKYVVTEERQITVPVTREEVRVEEVPLGEDPGPVPTEVTLHAERPVVTTEKVPVERVRLGKETVRDEETVVAPVRKERIEYTGPDPDSGR